MEEPTPFQRLGRVFLNKLVVHCKKDKFDVYIGRPSKYGNTYSHIKNASTLALYEADSREDAIQYFERDLIEKPELIEAVQNELRGKILGCYCAPEACHGEVLVKYANTQTFYYAALESEYNAIKDSDYISFSKSVLKDRKDIFYLISDKRYVEEILNDKSFEENWFIFRFYLNSDYILSLNEFKAVLMSKETYNEHWIPAEHLDDLNKNIVGKITLIGTVKP